MKPPRILVASLLVLFTGCAVWHPQPGITMTDRETVLTIYHVKTGHEQEFSDLLQKTWVDYTQANLVVSDPHLIVRDEEDGGKPRYVEIFTWVTHSSPQRASGIPAIKNDWATMHDLCEARNHPDDLEFSEVDIVAASQAP